VGRASEQAFAYLLVPGEHLVSRDARKRLRALMDFSELGAGFKIALNDLQIRGGGSILGSAQSGHIQAVGYELYLELLEKAVGELKGEGGEEEPVDPEIRVSLSAFIPEAFIPDTDQRLLAYKRLASLTADRELNDLAMEWRDRYGALPDEVKHLLLMAGLRLLMKKLRVARLESDEHSFSLRFRHSGDMQRASSVLEKARAPFSQGAASTLAVEIGRGRLSQRLVRLKRTLQQVFEHVTDTSVSGTGR